jgi:hypothetical protein
MIVVKILGINKSLRYSVRRVVETAHMSLLKEFPDLKINLIEIRDVDEILKYTPVLTAPGLVINEKLVFNLWIPKKEQVIAWLREAVCK